VIYLIMKMFIYLAVAVAAGFGAGWLTRNLTAARKEDELQRTLSETKSLVPQFESLMRSRDDQVSSLRKEVQDKDARLGELHAQMDLQEKNLKERERDLKRVQSRLAALDVSLQGDDALDYSGYGASAELTAEVKRLEGEVERLRRREVSLTAELRAARAGQSVPGSTAGVSAMEEVLRSELHELESRLRQTVFERDRLSKTLDQEKRKVTELERERELQNRSLLVLHQQLELARETGKRAAG